MFGKYLVILFGGIAIGYNACRDWLREEAYKELMQSYKKSEGGVNNGR